MMHQAHLFESQQLYVIFNR